MVKNPSLYEINTRVWLREFDKDSEKAKISDVPISFWQNLREKGFDYIWLMGVWETTPSLVEKCCFQSFLVESYSRSLKDWEKPDVIGSPYAINNYEFNQQIGSADDFLKLKKSLNEMGLGLILDFVPNHFSAMSEITKSNSEIFLHSSRELVDQDPTTFFQSYFNKKFFFTHGRDPFFPAWTDTIQLNYFNPATIEFMTNILLKISNFCDGVRCDMAMLVLNNVFNNTWRGIIDESKFPKPAEEFWKIAIDKIKSHKKDFLFIAEAYWNLEWELQQLGFDYTYDKKLLDRLKDGKPFEVSEHLRADNQYQMKSLRFIENHDEERAVTSLGIEKSFAAALIISSISGMKLFYDGQLVGKRIKLPVQLARAPKEKEIKVVQKYYDKLLTIFNDGTFKNGECRQLEPIQVHPDNYSSYNIFAWHWIYKNEIRVIVVNYSSETSQCRIKFSLPQNFDSNDVEIYDVLHDKGYIRTKYEITDSGLFIELGAYQGHIFTFQ